MADPSERPIGEVSQAPADVDKPRRLHFLGDGGIEASFEFFPPRTAEMATRLWSAIRRLEPFGPTSVAITYGAGGSTRGRTHSTVARILAETSLRPAVHLTCVASTRQEIDGVARDYWDMGVRSLVALRGDPAGRPEQPFVPHPGGYASAFELVRGMRAIHPFDITVAVHPEQHFDSRGLEQDLDLLEKKIEAGATRAITQYFFDEGPFHRLLDRARARRIEIPIIPGMLPIIDIRRTVAGAARRGVSIPRWLLHRYEGLGDDSKTQLLISAAVVAEQAIKLVDRGVKQFHFFTLNQAELVCATCHILGLRPTLLDPSASSLLRPPRSSDRR